MKLKGFAITLAVGAVVFTGCENAGSDAASSGEVVLNTKKDTVAYFMGMMTGKQLKDAFNFENLDDAIVAAGTKAGFEGDSAALFTQEEVGPMVQAYFQEMQAEKTKAQFPIIYDKNHLIMDAYDVTFVLEATKQKLYLLGGIDIDEASGNEDHVLPVPATFIIGTDGKIIARHFDKNYKNRMSVKEIVSILKQP